MANLPRDPLATLPNITELIEQDGQITLGHVTPIGCVAVANDEDNCLAALKRRPGESLQQLLVRLDAAIARAWDDDYFADEING
ncbi:hypothetical protein [Accumulibacter sp.]|uniref:hypothetical protein n=1 Tax=Accumulibacter sp. TaxID=2053492 RepID=UPI0025DDEE17|nr:hypothetical protein [Accumulibacter sp.]MCP5230225.1 hypothetical protein [Accumulibacter sp.]